VFVDFLSFLTNLGALSRRKCQVVNFELYRSERRVKKVMKKIGICREGDGKGLCGSV
jgi:hypothetical protein